MGADLVGELVLLDPVLRPLGIEDKLFLALFLAGLGDGDEIRAGPAALDDLVGNPLVGEPEVPAQLPERRIDNRVVCDDLFHNRQFSLNGDYVDYTLRFLRDIGTSQPCQRSWIPSHLTFSRRRGQGTSDTRAREVPADSLIVSNQLKSSVWRQAG